jgi:hypothetical protein
MIHLLKPHSTLIIHVFRFLDLRKRPFHKQRFRVFKLIIQIKDDVSNLLDLAL